MQGLLFAAALVVLTLAACHDEPDYDNGNGPAVENNTGPCADGQPVNPDTGTCPDVK
jgi:hypothetical protein